MSKYNFKRIKILSIKTAFPSLFLLLFLILWHLITLVFTIPDYIIPSPYKVLQRFATEIGLIFLESVITFMEGFLGFLISNLVGILLAIGFVHSKLFEKSFYPLTVAFKSIPLIAMAPLLTIWFGSGYIGKIVMASIISFFPIVVNTTIGMNSVDRDVVDLFRSLKASWWQILWKLRFPFSLPYIFSALKISAPLSIAGAIVAEFMGSTRGIGYTILIASYHLDTIMLFCGVIAASIMGLLFFLLVSLIEKKVLFWHASVAIRKEVI